MQRKSISAKNIGLKLRIFSPVNLPMFAVKHVHHLPIYACDSHSLYMHIHTHTYSCTCIHIYTHTYIDTQEINWCESIDEQFKLQSKYHRFDMEKFISTPTVEELNSLEKSKL